eukprot:1188435-Prorocentrum_minimum.AAC.1
MYEGRVHPELLVSAQVLDRGSGVLEAVELDRISPNARVGTTNLSVEANANRRAPLAATVALWSVERSTENSAASCGRITEYSYTPLVKGGDSVVELRGSISERRECSTGEMRQKCTEYTCRLTPAAPRQPQDS